MHQLTAVAAVPAGLIAASGLSGKSCRGSPAKTEQAEDAGSSHTGLYGCDRGRRLAKRLQPREAVLNFPERPLGSAALPLERDPRHSEQDEQPADDALAATVAADADGTDGIPEADAAGDAEDDSGGAIRTTCCSGFGRQIRLGESR